MLASLRDHGGGETSSRWAAGGAGTVAGVALLLVAVSLVLCLRFPNPTPQYDEFFHLLTARSLLHDGGWAIQDGARPYDRAWLFTGAVALSQWLFGETIAAARVPAACSGALLVGAVFLWVRRRVGWTAALLSSGMVMLALHPLNYASMVRFYSPHALAVFGAAVGTFEVAMAWRQHGLQSARRWVGCPGWVGWAVLALGCGLLALHLQMTTLIAAAAAGVWCSGLLLAWWWQQGKAVRTRSAWVLLAVVVPTAGLLWVTGGFAAVWQSYHTPRLWSAHSAGDTGFYHRMMMSWYAPLWLGLPAWAALGWWANPGGGQGAIEDQEGVEVRDARAVVGFCVVFVVVAMCLHSWMPVKAARYVLYVLPFVFIVAGIGVGVVLEAAWALVMAKLAKPDAPKARRIVVGTGTAALLVLVTAYGWYRTPGGYRALRMITGDVSHSPFLRSDWDAARPTLLPLSERASVTVHSAAIKPLYYLGRSDLGLSVQGQTLYQAKQGRMPINTTSVTTAAELQDLQEAYDSGLVTVEDDRWRNPVFVTDDAADWLEQHLDAVPVDPAWRLRVFTWGLNAPAAHDR